MASLSTFGNTLTDLQAGMNAAQGLEYQRANFHDQIAAQRVADQLRARSERDQNMARIIESRNVRNQQGQQFDVNQRNLMDAARLEAATREKVATINAGARGADPRFAQTIADIQFQNNEKQNEVAYFKKLSEQRKAAVRARDQIKANQGFFDFREPNDPQWRQLNDIIAKLDSQAITLGIAPAADGGYVVPDFTPIQVPAVLDPNFRFNLGGAPTNAPAVLPANPTSPVIPVTDPLGYVPPAPTARPASLPVVASGAFHHIAPPARDYTYKVDLNGNFIAVPNPALGTMQLGPSFLSNPTGYAP